MSDRSRASLLDLIERLGNKLPEPPILFCWLAFFVVLGSALAAALVLGLAVPSFASETVTEAQVAAAKTPADHEAIAKAYESKALAAEADAKGHEAMGRTYKVGGTPKGNSAAMVGHCERLAKSYRAAATEYRALAVEHRRLAVAVK